MLEAFAAGYVGEGEEEVVDVVVAGGVGGSRLADEVGELGEERGAEVGVFRGVGDYVDVVLGGDFGGEGVLVEVLAGDYGGVLELLDVGGGEVGGAALRMLWIVAVGGGEGGADAPAFGDGDGGWTAISLTGMLAG